jgi:hypothetical protein
MEKIRVPAITAIFRKPGVIAMLAIKTFIAKLAVYGP